MPALDLHFTPNFGIVAKEYAKRRVQYGLLLVEYWVFCILEDVSEICLTYLRDISREYKYNGKYELEYHVL